MQISLTSATTQAGRTPKADPRLSPIAILDSGLGGLTVARAMRTALPLEDIVYFGDTARVPYGGKSPRTIYNYLRQAISYLRPMRPKHVVLACNTATAIALPAVAAAFPELNISGVIDPGARAAAAAAGSDQVPIIGILATEATVRSGAYERAIHRRRTQARILLRPAPLLTPIVEEGRSCDDPLVKLALEQYLSPMIARGIQVLLLGCTHYPMLRPAIEAVVGPMVSVVDGGMECAQDVARRLKLANLLRPTSSRPGRMRSFVTEDPARFAMLSQRMGVPISLPELVELEVLERIHQEAPVRLRSAG